MARWRSPYWAVPRFLLDRRSQIRFTMKAILVAGTG
jgi:hypothetical protein